MDRGSLVCVNCLLVCIRALQGGRRSRPTQSVREGISSDHLDAAIFLIRALENLELFPPRWHLSQGWFFSCLGSNPEWTPIVRGSPAAGWNRRLFSEGSRHPPLLPAIALVTVGTQKRESLVVRPVSLLV